MSEANEVPITSHIHSRLVMYSRLDDIQTALKPLKNELFILMKTLRD